MSKIVTSSRQVGLSFANIKESSFLWKISNFSHLQSKFTQRLLSDRHRNSRFGPINDIIESPIFSAKGDDLKWCLVMFTTNGSEGTNTPVNLGFEFQSKDSRFFERILNFSITLTSGSKVDYVKKSENFFIKYSDSRPSYTSGLAFDFIQLSTLFDKCNGYLINDELHVLCQYQLADYKNHSVFTFESDNNVNRIILDRFEKEWEDQELCDYELIAPCGRKLLAHKFVLSAASPVFSAMLNSDMKEKRDGSVEITDISYEALEEMLRFLYSGKVKISHETVGDILSAAEKYQISHLKDKCQKFLADNLTTENTVMTLKFCKTFDLVDIQPKVDAFIRSNAELIFLNHAFSTLDDKTDYYDEMVESVKKFN